VAARLPAADAQGMFESGIGPGKRSDRFGTWALVMFLFLFLPFFGYGPFAPFAYGVFALIPASIGAFATIGAVACGLVGIVSEESDQRRAAFQGLLKAAPPALIGGWYTLVLWALMAGDWNLG
jgi:hypothetical protein